MGSLVASSEERVSVAVAVLTVVLAGAAAVAIVYPFQIVMGLGLAIGVIAIIRYPIPALGFLLLAAPFHTTIEIVVAQRIGQGGAWIDYWKDAAILAIFLRALAQRFQHERRWPFRSSGDNVLIFYILAFTGIAIASPPRPSVYPALGHFIEGPLVILAIVLLRPSRKQIYFLVSMVILAATVIAGAAVFEWFGPRTDFHRWYGAGIRADGQPFVVGAGVYRAGSFIYDPLVLGFYLAGAIPLALALTVPRTRWRSACAIGALVCIGGLIASLVRSGFIGGGIAVLVVLALVVRNPRIRISLIGMTLVIAGTVAAFYIAGGSETLLRAESNEIHRERVARAYGLVLERPQGYGLGTTDRNIFLHPDDPDQIGATENSYLSRALEGGVHGLALYLVALFVTILRLRVVRRRSLRAGDRMGVALAAGGIGAMVAIALCQLFLGVHELPVELLLWGPAGFALAWSSVSSDGSHGSSSGHITAEEPERAHIP